jgi:hypothetical protein
LLLQAIELAKQAHVLGAIILVRSAFEALGVLSYINEKTESVLRGEESLFAFDDTTTRLMLGPKNQSTPEASINILIVLERCEEKYPGILSIYGELSESAHPNFDRMYRGYSRVDEKKFITKFANQWQLSHRNRLTAAIELCVSTMHHHHRGARREIARQRLLYCSATGAEGGRDLGNAGK